MSYRFQTVFLCVVSLLFDIIVTANTSTDADIPFFASYFLTCFLFQLEKKKRENKLRKIKLSKTVMKTDLFIYTCSRAHV